MSVTRLFVFCCFCLLMTGPHVRSQAQHTLTVIGKILNKEKREPISYANVYLKKSQRGTSSTEAGHFTIHLHESELSDTLVLSAIGYKTTQIAARELAKSREQIVLLEEEIVNLNEVTVKAEAAVDIIRKAIQHRADNYGIDPHKLQGVYRIVDREDGAYMRLVEAAVNIYDKDYLNRNSRVVDYLAVRHSKDYRTFRWKMDKLNSRNVEELLKPDLIKRPTRATHANGFDKGFSYAFEGYSTLDGKEILIVSATKNPAYSWPNYNATFYVRAQDRAIIRVDRDYSIPRPNWAKEDGVKTKISKDQLILQYKDHNGKLYLSHIAWNLAGDIVNETDGKKIIKFERVEDLAIEKVSFEKPEKVRAAWSSDIYQMREPYNAVFWENFPIADTQLFADVSKELDEKENIQEQFKSESSNEETGIGKLYSARELREDLSVLRKSLEEGHPALYRYTSREKMDHLFDSVNTLISEPMTELEFYRSIRPVLTNIHCGHTLFKLSLNHAKFVEHRNYFFPVQTTLVNDTLIVVDPTPDGSISREDVIMSINGRDVSEIIDVLRSSIGADGYVKTYRDMIVARHFPELYYLNFGRFDEFDIRTRDSANKVTERKIGATSQAALNIDQRNQVKNEYKTITPDVAYLKVASFTDHKDVAYKQWVKNAFIDIKRNNKKHLIIDIRNNNGGRDDYALYLFSFLSKKPFTYHKSLHATTNRYSFLRYTNQDSTLNTIMTEITKRDSSGNFLLNGSHPTLGVHAVQDLNYDGSVYILVNGGTFSAASDFAAVCKQNIAATFIGQETGGAAVGNTSNGEIILTLPNSQIRVTLPLFMIVNDVDSSNSGRGVLPDHEIQYTIKEALSEADKELNLAIRLSARK